MTQPIGAQKREKKRIGFVHYTLPPAISGVEMVIRDHARLLSENGFRIFLLGANGKKFRTEIDLQLSPTIDPKNKKVLRVQEQLKQGEISSEFLSLKKHYVSLVTKWIETNRLDYVIVHNVMSRHYNLAFTAALSEVAETMKDHIKFVTWVHDASFIDMSYTGLHEGLKHTYPWNLISEPQPQFTYATISETRKKELLKLYHQKVDITVIPNGLDLNKMLPLPMQTRKLFQYILQKNPDYIGLIPVRIAQRKNIEYAIETARVARDKHNLNLFFVITGALHLQNVEAIKYFDFLKSKVKEYKLTENFIFLYNYKFEDGEKFDILKLNIRDLYLISDFLFFPSTGEGFGLPLIEAGFMRIPIFASDIPVFNEIGQNYINFLDFKLTVDENLDKMVKILQRSRSTTFHKIILQKYGLRKIITDNLIPFLLNLQNKV